MRNKILGFIVLALWIFLYAGGTIISTQPYRDSLNNISLGNALYFKSWIIVICFYTPSNVVVLCCLSSIMGGILKNDKTEILNLAISGILMYLLLSSAVLILGTQSFDNFTQAGYIKLAGTYSLFSIYTGYNQKMIVRGISNLLGKQILKK